MFFENVSVIKKGHDLNKKWIVLFNSKQMSIREIDLGANPIFFCIGSCFAENIRKSLENSKKNCYPNYAKLIFDKSNQMVDLLSFGSMHMSYYSSSSILQEFKRSLGDEKDYPAIKIDGMKISEGRKQSNANTSIFQDPYRREVFSNSDLSIDNLSHEINKTIRDGLEKSNIFIITLGLVEIFKSRKTGLIFNQYPGYMGSHYGGDDVFFYKMKYDEVYSDLLEIISIIKKLNINNKIIFSVSPVPLQRTFTENDIYVANTYSKSTLRSAVENVIDESNGVFYFPAYEIASNIGSEFFQERDLRHPKSELVDLIIQLFLKAAKL